jgi:hypothetical protein
MSAETAKMTRRANVDGTNEQHVNERDCTGFGSSNTNTGFGGSGSGGSLFGGASNTNTNTGFGGAYQLCVFAFDPLRAFSIGTCYTHGLRRASSGIELVH